MGCDFPIKAYRTTTVGPNGKPLISFNPIRWTSSSLPFSIPCNNCIGCRLERSRQWSVRMTHESKLYNQNVFLTLTYDNQHVPDSFGLDIRHWQLFMRYLRRHNEQRLRFFACGEYGDENLRPHFHAIIFNLDFKDKKVHTLDRKGEPIWVSATLSKIWGKGFATIQAVTPASAAYVARYSVKKIKHDGNPDHYYRPSPVNGVFYHVRPEFAVMSRKPGIGHAYTTRYRSDYFPSGSVVVQGRLQGVPKYYLNQLSEEEREFLKRRNRSLPMKPEEQTMERKMARAAVRDARITRLKRTV